MARAKDQTPRILVVEDENVVALDIRRDLVSFGYTVPATASSGEDAIEKAAALRPDLVLMDIRLRGPIDGIEAAEEIRARFNIPAIYLTAYADPATLGRARLTGALGYLIKPFGERELHAAVEVALYRHQLEQRVKESEQWLAATLRSIADGVIATDEQGRIRFMNPVAEHLTGWSAAEAAAHQIGEVLKLEYSMLPAEAARQRSAQGNIALEGALISRRGIEIPVEERKTAIHDDGGSVVGTVMAIRDISERRGAEIEREQLLSQLARSNTELRELAVAATHGLGLRQPRMKLAIAGQYESSGQGTSGDLERLRKSADRIASMVNDLLEYAEVDSARGKARPVDLGRLARKVIGGMDERVRAIQAEVEVGSLPTVEALPAHMHTLLRHLIDNALKFRRLDQPVRVRLRANFPGSGGRGAAKVVELYVEDNGIGFDREHARKLFQPFQRLHRGQYEGNGMGLAICRKIVERHGGRISAISSPNRGTRLRVILPLKQRR
jgi:PAS domain S-box-containing protein